MEEEDIYRGDGTVGGSGSLWASEPSPVGAGAAAGPVGDSLRSREQTQRLGGLFALLITEGPGPAGSDGARVRR